MSTTSTGSGAEDRAATTWQPDVALRRARGWSLTDLSRETGITATELSRIERGVREVRLRTLLRLLRALDAHPAELCEGLADLSQVAPRRQSDAGHEQQDAEQPNG